MTPKLPRCPSCGGFVPRSLTRCPGCTRALPGWLRVVATVVGGGALAMTLSACYGGSCVGGGCYEPAHPTADECDPIDEAPCGECDPATQSCADGHSVSMSTSSE